MKVEVMRERKKGQHIQKKENPRMEGQRAGKNLEKL